MMTRRLWLIAYFSLGMLLPSAAARAFTLSGFGGKLGYSTPENLDGTAMIGAHMELEQSGTRLHLIPNLMCWKVNGVSDVNPNVDLYYHFVPEGLITPYLGGGLGLNMYDRERRSSNTEVGLNLFGGLRMPGPYSHYFVEGRYTASDISQFSVLGGVTFHNR